MRKAIPLLVLSLILGLLLVQTGCSKKEDPVTPDPVACAITMTNPGEFEGQKFDTGLPINIRWTKTTGGNVKIELFKGADMVGTISDQTLNDGFHPWNSSTTFGQPTAEDYSIGVTHLSDASCQGRTNTFKMVDISNCFVTFTLAGRDNLPDQVAGDELVITWESGHTSGFVNLELWYEPFTQMGELVGIIEEHVVDSGTYSWIVDSFNQGADIDEGYRLKIRDDRPGDHNCDDRSVPFRIADDFNCFIEVMGIGGGQSFGLGTVLPISFGFVNSSKVVRLRLYTGNLQVPVGLITNSFDTQNGTASFNWTVDYYQHNQPVFNRFNVRAFDVDDEYCVGQSSNFAITP